MGEGRGVRETLPIPVFRARKIGRGPRQHRETHGAEHHIRNLQDKQKLCIILRLTLQLVNSLEMGVW